jgi:hypothetical protein
MSAPAFAAKVSASTFASIVLQMMIWLVSLTTSPIPTGPTRRGVPIAVRTGSAARKSSSDAPAMIVSVPLVARAGPPETGASTKRNPPARNRASKPRVATGEIVDMSMNSVPGAARRVAPCSPKSASSTCGASGTQVTTTCDAAPTPAGSPPSLAPSATSRSTPSRRRCAHTVTAKDARSSAAAIGSPMVPTPMSPTCVVIRAASVRRAGRDGLRPNEPATVRALAAFVRLTRPLFLYGGFAGVALGAAVAVWSGHRLDAATYAWAQAAVTAFQLMVHYANDYFDRDGDRAGARTSWSGGSGVLAEGTLPPHVALVAALVCASAGAAASAHFALAGNAVAAAIGIAIGAALVGVFRAAAALGGARRWARSTPPSSSACSFPRSPMRRSRAPQMRTSRARSRCRLSPCW